MFQSHSKTQRRHQTEHSHAAHVAAVFDVHHVHLDCWDEFGVFALVTTLQCSQVDASSSIQTNFFLSVRNDGHIKLLVPEAS